MLGIVLVRNDGSVGNGGRRMDGYVLDVFLN